MTKKICVTGAGGFIGSWLCKKLADLGHVVIGVDLHKPEFSPSAANGFVLRDLRFEGIADILDEYSIDEVYHLAADMGGIGFITANHADITRHNTQIDLSVLESVRKHGRPGIKFLYSSSACVYAQYRQKNAEVVPLQESDAWPADPEEGYGLQKLYTEKLLEYYRKDYGLDVRVVRFHNCYGAEGTWCGGREKAPAAACRKVAVLPAEGGELEIWGDGEQTRSFMHIDDCVEGLMRLMASDYPWPINLGRSELVSINELFDAVAAVSGKKITKRYNLNAPQGVRGRNSCNKRSRNVLGNWEPTIDLQTGIAMTYPWIEQQVKQSPVT